MSRLTQLIRQAKERDPDLGAELEREYRTLSNRRAFGLNFERHRPEAVELPGRPVRRGDKVRVLAPRGSSERGDQSLWHLTRIERSGGVRVGHLEPIGPGERDGQVVSCDELVVVAEFRDPIHPGLVSTGRVARGDAKPVHTVVTGENFHVLKALTFTHKGTVDVIYIDPPYNSGAKDWKYNNDYVESDDIYRHSKWLAFMERRLLLARELLNPEDSVLIVAIDEKEYLRLGLMLGDLFPDSTIQMVTTVVSAKGAVRAGQFSRVEEHLFFVTIGAARLSPWHRNMLDPAPADAGGTPIEWLGLRRREPSSIRGARPNQFYPIFVDQLTGRLVEVGDAVSDGVDRSTVHVPSGAVALWPLKPNGTEMLWGLTPEVLRRNWERGYARVNRWRPDEQRGTVQYLPGGTIDMIDSGDIIVSGRAPDGSVIGTLAADDESPPPKRVWNLPSHNAEAGGTKVLSALIPGRRFPYPKSLYAVEDTLRFCLAEKPNALVLDFFAGSGTTAHAVMRLNKQDGGCRRSVSVTNNEVSPAEAERLRSEGARPGDPGWEALGICDFITKPRIEAAITGCDPSGKVLSGDYKYTDEFPLAEGFDENAEFFTLTYESPVAIGHNRAFERIAPLLWLKAGAQGRRIDSVPEAGWDIADRYGLLTDLDCSSAFVDALRAAPGTRFAFVVTDDERRFQAVARSLPESVAPIRLYESYLSNFRFTGVEP